uniref:MFS domain-containing protein n=1 Tax=Globodera pallida TaxID=36090 RepID=A0A183C7Z9_GLOPA
MAKSSGSYKISPLNGQQQPPATTEKCPEAATDKQKPKTAWGLIYLCTFFTFSSSVQFTMFLTSMWPFMRILDKSVTVGFFGLVIAMYSVSQIIASPILGIWSNRIGKLKPPLIFCNLTMFVGNFMYFLVELFPTEQTRYVMVISRFIAGIGWAQVGLLKSFASSASVTKDRTKATAFITGGVAMGVTLGPALQMLFTFIDYPGVPLCAFGFCLNISMFTVPALFASLVNLFWFQETYVGIVGQKKSDNKKAVEAAAPAVPPYDRWAVGVCYAMRFTQYFIYTNLET